MTLVLELIEREGVLENKYGRWALVTGASRGIGAAVASELAGRGFDIVLAATDLELLNKHAAEIRQKFGRQTRALAVNLEQAEEAAEALQRCTEDLDLGLAVLNAGVTQFGQLHRTEPNRLRSLIEINITSTALLSQAFAKRFVERGAGGLILVSSPGAYIMIPNESHYAASKAYVGRLGEILHYELRSRNVDVLTVYPPLVDTDMITGHEMKREWDFQKLPKGMRKKAKPSEIARAAVDALGRRASVHPPAAAEISTWLLRRLPDRLRCRILDDVFAKAVYPENAWR